MRTSLTISILVVAAIATLAYAIWGRADRERAPVAVPSASVIPVSELTLSHPVKAIELEYHQTDLPPGPGHDVFAAQCVICHSPRYVLNQPIFPRKTWIAEVQKMIKAYGAPIDPAQEKEIVNYLVSWHGKEDALVAGTSVSK